MEDNPQQPVKFNMAIATLENMQKILYYIDTCSIKGDFFGWNEGLMTLRRSISPFITGEDLKEIDKKFNDLNKTHWMYRTEKKKLRVIPGQIGRVYSELDALTIFQRGAMNKAGLLMPKSDDPRFALEG